MTEILKICLVMIMMFENDAGYWNLDSRCEI
jgi:hypothetical protein